MSDTLDRAQKNTSEEIFELADELKAKKQQKKELDEAVKDLNKEIAELDTKLSDAMAENELENFKRSGSLFYLSTKLYASPQAGKKDEMIEALREQGYGDLVTENVNAQTLSSFCKGLIEESEEEELPDWLANVVNTYEKVSVGVRKG